MSDIPDDNQRHTSRPDIETHFTGDDCPAAHPTNKSLDDITIPVIDGSDVKLDDYAKRQIIEWAVGRLPEQTHLFDRTLEDPSWDDMRRQAFELGGNKAIAEMEANFKEAI